jgi:methyl-accepting chemotaxis protein
MPRHQRKRFFIDREFQGRYIFNAFISVAAGSILFALIFSFFSSNTLSIVYENYHLKLGTTPELLLDKIFSTQWLFIVLGGLIVMLVTLFLSHRIAGPAYRFEQTLGNMISGDLTSRIYLRKHDEGKALGKKIDEFNDMLSISLGKLMESSEQIQKCCDDRPSSEDEVAIREAHLTSRLEEIRRHNQESLELLREFKLR